MDSYHIAMVSDPMAGKTTLLNTLKNGSFSPPPKVTEQKLSASDLPDWGGASYQDSDRPRGKPRTEDERHSLSINIDGNQRALEFLDGGRAARSGRMDATYFTIPLQITGANAIVICFDASDNNALRRSFRLLQMAQREADYCKTPVFLVGLKADKRVQSISFDDAQREANKHLCDNYYECSAKTGEGVNKLFSAIVHELDAIKKKGGSVPRLTTFEERQKAAERQKQELAINSVNSREELGET